MLGDKDLARADADAAIRLEPSVEAWLVRAQADGGNEHAAADADQASAAKIAPGDLGVRLWKVNQATHREDYAAALPLVDAVIASNPEVSSLLVGRAEIESRLGRTAAMQADFDRARVALVDARLLCQGEVEAKALPNIAQADCARALKVAPGSSFILVDQAILSHRLGDDVGMNQALDGALATNRTAEQLNSICYAVAQEDMALDRALAACDASLKRRPLAAATLDSRAFVLMRMGRDAEALAAYDAALDKDPTRSDSLFGRGLVEARLGRGSDAQRDTSLALAAEPYLRQKFAQMGVR